MDSSNASKEQGLINLAIQEGHDADIPSNEGVLNTQQPSPSSSSIPGLDKDVEKASGKLDSRTSSTHNLAEEKQNDSEVDERANEVWWDGPDDPQNPMNWSSKRKWGCIIVVSAITFL